MADLEKQMEATNFWDRPSEAQKVVAQLKSLKARFDPLKLVIADFEDAKIAYEMARESNDKDLLAEADTALFKLYGKPDAVPTTSFSQTACVSVQVFGVANPSPATAAVSNQTDVILSATRPAGTIKQQISIPATMKSLRMRISLPPRRTSQSLSKPETRITADIAR